MRAPAPSLRPIIGAPDGLGEVHHLVDLLGEHLAERAAEDGEVLREHEDLAAVDRPPTGDHAVGERAGVLDPEAVGPVAGEHVELDEGVGVEEPGRGAPAPVSLPRACWRSTAAALPAWSALLAEVGELVEPLLDRVGYRRDRDPRALVAVQRLGLGLFLDLGLFDGHGPPNVSGRPASGRPGRPEASAPQDQVRTTKPREPGPERPGAQRRERGRIRARSGRRRR